MQKFFCKDRETRMQPQCKNQTAVSLIKAAGFRPSPARAADTETSCSFSWYCVHSFPARRSAHLFFEYYNSNRTGLQSGERRRFCIRFGCVRGFWTHGRICRTTARTAVHKCKKRPPAEAGRRLRSGAQSAHSTAQACSRVAVS